jgi:group I intron endonuclease
VIKSAIYIIKCSESNKVYVGSAINYVKRWADHKWDLKNQKHCNSKLQNSWNKHGAAKFDFAILEYVENPQDLLKREQYWIDYYDSYKSGYNMTPIAGSPLGRKQTEETIKKLREINLSPEFRKAHSERHSGKIVSSETRERQRIAKLGKKQSTEACQKRSSAISAYWEKIRTDHIAALERKNLIAARKLKIQGVNDGN